MYDGTIEKPSIFSILLFIFFFCCMCSAHKKRIDPFLTTAQSRASEYIDDYDDYYMKYTFFCCRLVGWWFLVADCRLRFDDKTDPEASCYCFGHRLAGKPLLVRNKTEQTLAERNYFSCIDIDIVSNDPENNAKSVFGQQSQHCTHVWCVCAVLIMQNFSVYS